MTHIYLPARRAGKTTAMRMARDAHYAGVEAWKKAVLAKHPDATFKESGNACYAKVGGKIIENYSYATGTGTLDGKAIDSPPKLEQQPWTKMTEQEWRAKAESAGHKVKPSHWGYTASFEGYQSGEWTKGGVGWIAHAGDADFFNRKVVATYKGVKIRQQNEPNSPIEFYCDYSDGTVAGPYKSVEAAKSYIDQNSKTAYDSSGAFLGGELGNSPKKLKDPRAKEEAQKLSQEMAELESKIGSLSGSEKESARARHREMNNRFNGLISKAYDATNHLGEREYQTYGAWRAAAKTAGATRFEGDKDIANAFGPDGKSVGEWGGDKGSIYTKDASTGLGPKTEYTKYSTWYNFLWGAFPSVRFSEHDTSASAFNRAGQMVAFFDKRTNRGYVHLDAPGSNSPSQTHTGDVAERGRWKVVLEYGGKENTHEVMASTEEEAKRAAIAESRHVKVEFRSAKFDPVRARDAAAIGNRGTLLHVHAACDAASEAEVKAAIKVMDVPKMKRYRDNIEREMLNLSKTDSNYSSLQNRWDWLTEAIQEA